MANIVTLRARLSLKLVFLPFTKLFKEVLSYSGLESYVKCVFAEQKGPMHFLFALIFDQTVILRLRYCVLDVLLKSLHLQFISGRI